MSNLTKKTPLNIDSLLFAHWSQHCGSIDCSISISCFASMYFKMTYCNFKKAQRKAKPSAISHLIHFLSAYIQFLSMFGSRIFSFYAKTWSFSFWNFEKNSKSWNLANLASRLLPLISPHPHPTSWQDWLLSCVMYDNLAVSISFWETFIVPLLILLIMHLVKTRHGHVNMVKNLIFIGGGR